MVLKRIQERINYQRKMEELTARDEKSRKANRQLRRLDRRGVSGFHLPGSLDAGAPLLDEGEKLHLLERLQGKYKRGWKRNLWIPEVLSTREIHNAHDIIDKLSPEDATQRRLEDFRDTFMLINGFDSFNEAAPAILNSMIKSKLAFASANRYISKMSRGQLVSDTLRRTQQAAAFLHSLEESKTAADYPVEKCIALFSEVKKKDMVAGAALEFMLRTGLRFVDLTTLSSIDVVFEKNKIIFRVKAGKNRRNRRDRVIARLPLWFGEFSKETVVWFEKSSELFETYTTNKVNQALKRIKSAATTYTFRRAFMARAIKESGYDFDFAAKNYTLHKDPQTLKAYYDSLPSLEETLSK